LGHGRSTRDAGRDGRIGYEQAHGTAGRERKTFGLGKPVAGASCVGGKCDACACSGSRTA
ncbi:MAG: hypothetical protein WB991_10335, partial [Candidatus Sulfotelmatobacter sp.]